MENEPNIKNYFTQKKDRFVVWTVFDSHRYLKKADIVWVEKSFQKMNQFTSDLQFKNNWKGRQIFENQLIFHTFLFQENILQQSIKAIPETYVLYLNQKSYWKQKKKAFDQILNQSPRSWIVKKYNFKIREQVLVPSIHSLNQLLNSIESEYEYMLQQQQKQLKEQNITNITNNQENKQNLTQIQFGITIQEYIKSSLLLEGKQFYVYGLLLIQSVQPFLVVYQNIYAKKIHYTNNILDYQEGEVDLLSDYISIKLLNYKLFLDERYKQEYIDQIYQKQYEKLSKICEVMKNSAQNQQNFQQKNTFQLLGVRTIIDSGLEPYIFKIELDPRLKFDQNNQIKIDAENVINAFIDLQELALIQKYNLTELYRKINGYSKNSNYEFQVIFNEINPVVYENPQNNPLNNKKNIQQEYEQMQSDYLYQDYEDLQKFENDRIIRQNDRKNKKSRKSNKKNNLQQKNQNKIDL